MSSKIVILQLFVSDKEIAVTLDDSYTYGDCSPQYVVNTQMRGCRDLYHLRTLPPIQPVN